MVEGPYRPYAELLKRTFQIDVERCECGEPLEPPRRAPARDPPYFKSKVLRRKLGELN
jgi:hypothetical protein